MFINQLKEPLSDVCFYVLAVRGGGGGVPPSVVRLGSNGFWSSKFLSINSCKNYVAPRGVQRNCIFRMPTRRPITILSVRKNN